MSAPVAEAAYGGPVADSGVGLLDPADSGISLYDPDDSSVGMLGPAGSRVDLPMNDGSGPLLVDASGVGRQRPVRGPDDRGPARPGEPGGPRRQTTKAPDRKSKRARKNAAAAGAVDAAALAAASITTVSGNTGPSAAVSADTGPRAAVDTGVRAPSRPAQSPSGPQRPSKAQPKPAQPKPVQPGAKPQPARTKSSRKSSRRILSNRTLALAGASTVMAGAAFLILTRPTGNGEATQTHVLATPDSLACYVKQPQLAVQMQAKAVQQDIVKASSGSAKNVIYAVYENSTCGATVSDPQVFLFLGGNHTGTPGSFVSAFTGQLPGAEPTSAGSLGGEAACVPSVDGRPAECLWADNDTFGAVTSATLDASSLAKEMRQMRPFVEQSVGKHAATTPSTPSPSPSH